MQASDSIQVVRRTLQAQSTGGMTMIKAIVAAGALLVAGSLFSVAQAHEERIHDEHSGRHHDWHSGAHRGPHSGYHFDYRNGWHWGRHFGWHSGRHHDVHKGHHHDWYQIRRYHD